MIERAGLSGEQLCADIFSLQEYILFSRKNQCKASQCSSARKECFIIFKSKVSQARQLLVLSVSASEARRRLDEPEKTFQVSRAPERARRH